MKTLIKTFILYLLYSCMFLMRANAASELPDIHIVIGDSSKTTTQIVQALKQRLPTAHVVANQNQTVNANPGGTYDKREIAYIAVGPSILRSLLAKRVNGVIISTFTSSQAYQALLQTTPEAMRMAKITAIYAEPSPVTQLKLITMIYKKKVSTAVILSDKTVYLEPLLKQAALETGTKLHIEYLSNENGWRVLNPILNNLRDVPTILAMPDSALYNAENLRDILVTTYRHNQSVIGFSAALVNAGALASATSNVEDISAQVAELLQDYQRTGKLAKPQFPKYFSVMVNHSVARSLNLIIDDAVKNFSRKPVSRAP